MKRGFLFLLLTMIGTATFSTTLPADDVAIENLSDRIFYYALRVEDGGAWSKTYEVPAGETQTHSVAKRVRISYLSDKAQFGWLEANQTYRISDAVGGQLRAVTEVRRPALPDVPDESTANNESHPSDAASDLTSNPGAATNADSTAMDLPSPDETTDNTASDVVPTAGDRPAPTARPAPSPANAEPAEESFDGLFDISNRVVTVRVIADDTFRNSFPEWRARARSIVAGASQYYQREYSIRLVVTETSSWNYNAVHDDLDARWTTLLEESPHDVDLIIALVGYGDYSSVEGTATYTGQLGRAAFFGQHLLVADRQDYHENRAKTILIHELGHIFGAFHVSDQNLMMYPGYLQLPTDEIIAGTVAFGETIDGVFALTKEFVFRDGVNSLSRTTQRRIQSLYQLHGLASETRQTDPITSGYQYLEQRAQIIAKQMTRRAEESRGAFDDLTN